MGKCLEQGLMEVMEEEELASMRAHQQHYEQVGSLLFSSSVGSEALHALQHLGCVQDDNALAGAGVSEAASMHILASLYSFRLIRR